MELYKLISFMIYNILSVYVGVRIIELFLIRNYRRQKMAIFLYSGTWLINSIVSILDCGIIFYSHKENKASTKLALNNNEIEFLIVLLHRRLQPKNYL